MIAVLRCCYHAYFTLDGQTNPRKNSGCHPNEKGVFLPGGQVMEEMAKVIADGE